MQSTVMCRVLKDLSATRKLGVELVKRIPSSSVLLIQGELGAGKTSLVQGIAIGLAIPEPITSPTFALAQHYVDGKCPLIHLDLYRLKNRNDANLLFLQEEEEASAIGALLAVEWPERLSISLPEAWRVNLQYGKAGDRLAQLIEPQEKSKNSLTSNSVG